MKTIATDIPNPHGREKLQAGVEVKYEDGRLSISGVVGTKRQLAEGDAATCGQCIDAIAGISSRYLVEEFKKADLDRLVEIWRRWHLNDLTAGSPAQEEWLRTNPVTFEYPDSHYTAALEALTAAGLNPDPNYLYKDEPYNYGHAWLTEELPTDVIEWAQEFHGGQ